MIVVTGAAGFIGSAIVQELNNRGSAEIIVVDDADHGEKKKNLASLKFREILGKDAFLKKVHSGDLPKMDALIHMGACSSTTETDEAYLNKVNFAYTRDLAEYAAGRGVRFIYASSAATYGNGARGYSDDESGLDGLRPLNLYGYSKHRFDIWARDQGLLKSIVGLKYFNVYGPNEYHKKEMQSLVRKGFSQILETGKIRLFKSYKAEYADGGQERDFLYVKDAVAMTLFFLAHGDIGGLFNVGSGVARNWNDLAAALFSAMDRSSKIEYIEMPESIREQYQYHTCAEMGKLRKAGYDRLIGSLEAGIRDYVTRYLIPGKRLGE